MPIALFEPDIPQNTGTILRLAACLGIEAHLIEPAGFPTSDRAFRRAGMDYLDAVKLVRHASWESFAGWHAAQGMRLVLFTTGATASYLDHRYEPRDILLFGRESAGVPAHVHAAAQVRLRIPMQAGLRSLNVAMTCAMAVGEALRQTGGVGEFRPGPERLETRAAVTYRDAMTFTRITIDPAVCTGKPCIRGLRFPVARLLGLMAAGETREAILEAYPYLEPGDIDEALRYAAFLAEDETVTLRPAEPVK